MTMAVPVFLFSGGRYTVMVGMSFASLPLAPGASPGQRLKAIGSAFSWAATGISAPASTPVNTRHEERIFFMADSGVLRISFVLLEPHAHRRQGRLYRSSRKMATRNR